jgi:hypothetical protein
MPYSKFTNIEDIAQKFQLTLKSTILFPTKKAIQPSSWLLETLDKAQKMRYLNEKERSERLTNPILTEIHDKNNYINLPLFKIVEAKRNDLEYGTAQCAAQMVGMQLFNQQKGATMNTIFGATTNGREWKFMQLTQNTLCIDEEIFEITDHRLSFLLGALQTIIEKCKNN